MFTDHGSSFSSNENDINMRLAMVWTAIDRLPIIWKSDLTDKIKHIFLWNEFNIATFLNNLNQHHWINDWFTRFHTQITSVNFTEIPHLVQSFDASSRQLIQILHDWINASLLENCEYGVVAFWPDIFMMLWKTNKILCYWFLATRAVFPQPSIDLMKKNILIQNCLFEIELFYMYKNAFGIK